MDKKKFEAVDFKSLEKLRDEVKVQAHLFKADMKDQWKKVESDWEKLQGELKPVKKATEQSANDVKAATQLLFDSVKQGYERIKRSLS